MEMASTQVAERVAERTSGGAQARPATTVREGGGRSNKYTIELVTTSEGYKEVKGVASLHVHPKVAALAKENKGRLTLVMSARTKVLAVSGWLEDEKKKKKKDEGGNNETTEGPKATIPPPPDDGAEPTDTAGERGCLISLQINRLSLRKVGVTLSETEVVQLKRLEVTFSVLEPSEIALSRGGCEADAEGWWVVSSGQSGKGRFPFPTVYSAQAASSFWEMDIVAGAHEVVVASGELASQHLMLRSGKRRWRYKSSFLCEAHQLAVVVGPMVATVDPEHLGLTYFVPEQCGSGDRIRGSVDFVYLTVKCIEDYLEIRLPCKAMHVVYLPPSLADVKCWSAAGVIFCDACLLHGVKGTAGKAIDDRVEIIRQIAWQWFGLAVLPEKKWRDYWGVYGLREHVVMRAIQSLFGEGETQWRWYTIEKGLCTNGGAHVTGMGLPPLELPKEGKDVSGGKQTIGENMTSLWEMRAAAIVELLARHVTSGFFKMAVRKKVRGVQKAKRFFLNMPSMLLDLVEEGVITQENMDLFDKRWIKSNVCPRLGVGMMFDDAKSEMVIAIRQEDVGFYDNSDTSSGQIILQINDHLNEAHNHVIPLQRRRVLCEQKFLNIRKKQSKPGRKSRQQIEEEKKMQLEGKLNPVRWFAVDPDGLWLATIEVRQPETQFAIAISLVGEEKVRAQLNALDGTESFFQRHSRRKVRLKLHPVVGKTSIESLTERLTSMTSNTRVRQRAAEVLGGVFTRDNPAAGLVALIGIFRRRLCRNNSDILSPNDFDSLKEVEVYGAAAVAMAEATVRLESYEKAETDINDVSGIQAETAELLIHAMLYNDNRYNSFDDDEWLSYLVRAVNFLFTVNKPSWLSPDLMTLAVSGIERIVKLSKLSPYASKNHAATEGCRALATLAFTRPALLESIRRLFDELLASMLPLPVMVALRSYMMELDLVLAKDQPMEQIIIARLLKRLLHGNYSARMCTSLLEHTTGLCAHYIKSGIDASRLPQIQKAADKLWKKYDWSPIVHLKCVAFLKVLEHGKDPECFPIHHELDVTLDVKEEVKPLLPPVAKLEPIKPKPPPPAPVLPKIAFKLKSPPKGEATQVKEEPGTQAGTGDTVAPVGIATPSGAAGGGESTTRAEGKPIEEKGTTIKPPTLIEAQDTETAPPSPAEAVAVKKEEQAVEKEVGKPALKRELTLKFKLNRKAESEKKNEKIDDAEQADAKLESKAEVKVEVEDTAQCGKRKAGDAGLDDEGVNGNDDGMKESATTKVKVETDSAPLPEVPVNPPVDKSRPKPALKFKFKRPKPS